MCFPLIGLNPFEYKRRKLAGINKVMSESLREAAGNVGSAQKVAGSLAEILASLELTERKDKGTKFGREVTIRDKPEANPQPKESDEVRLTLVLSLLLVSLL